MIRLLVCLTALLFMCPAPRIATAQNWVLSIRDVGKATPLNQVNGVAGDAGIVYATILNFTGAPASDDGTGNPAPPTLLDFVGLGFTQNPDQDDLGSWFIPNSLGIGYPQVPGSFDSISAGSSGLISLGYFDLSQVAAGTYVEDFVAQAFPDDFLSNIQFGDIHGTLILNVTPSVPMVPEPASSVYILCCLCGITAWAIRRNRVFPKPHHLISG